MSYENFRNDITEELLKTNDADVIRNLLNVIDKIACNYNFERKSTDLILIQNAIPPIVKTYVASKAIEGKSKATTSEYLRTIAKFFKTVRLPIEEITTNDIRAYLYQYQEEHKVSNSTLNQIRSILCTFFAWCTDEEYISSDPAKKIGTIKHQETERDFLTSIELEIIRSACKTLRERALVNFLYSTACRVSETCDMLISDVDFESQTVTIRHGKGDKFRKSYLNASAIISLKAYLDSRNDDSPYLFVRNRNYLTGTLQLKPKAIELEISKILSRTSISKNIVPHSFRHTAATSALQHGMPVDQVQKFLGHSKIDTTLRYARTSDDDIKSSHIKCLAG